MRKKQTPTRMVCAALAVAALAVLALAGSASAKLTGEYVRFQQCPWTKAEVVKCLYSVTNGGEVVLGTKKVTITGETILQGGVTEEDESGNSSLVAASNGITLSKTPLAVPGGLLGIVPPESSPPLVKALSKFFFENALTGVNSTLELAKTASDVKLNQNNLAEEEGVTLKMPVKVHLENPFLGKSCFVGSSSSPITFELTTGTTSPPGPNKPITGKSGKLKLIEGGRILSLTEAELVDNAWSAPAASGCGGILSFLVNPIINGQIGLPSASGKNTALLKNNIFVAAAVAVKENNEKNP